MYPGIKLFAVLLIATHVQNSQKTSNKEKNNPTEKENEQIFKYIFYKRRDPKV